MKTFRPKKNSSFRKKTYRKPTIKKAIRTIKRKSLVKTIKKVIHSQVETKQAFHTSSNAALTTFNSLITVNGDYLRVLPQITTGAADNQRIGDQLRLQNVMIKGYIKFNPTILTGDSKNPAVMARLFVLSLKKNLFIGDVQTQTTALSGLLKKGGTTTAWTGILSDIYAPVNTDLFTVHHDRRYYLNQTNFVTMPTTNTGVFPSDIKNTVKFFSLPLKVRNKLLRYDANFDGGLSPINYAPFILLGYTYLDGSAPDNLTTNLGLHYDVIMNFEDA